MLSHNSWFNGAPPTLIFTLSRIPASWAAFTTSAMTGMVVVSRAEQPMMPALCSIAAWTKAWGSTSTPRSTTSMPLPSTIIFTRFLPMSCRSPLTVPSTITPRLSAPSSASRGLSRAAPAFMARAATSTSGTKISLARNLTPTRSMPGSSPSVRISWAEWPSSSACWTYWTTSFFLPFSKALPISIKVLICDLLYGIRQPDVFTDVLSRTGGLYRLWKNSASNSCWTSPWIS